MGGHEHGHHHEPYKVPNPNTYKVENAAELIYVRDELAKRGLKDPWIRNEVWRYNKAVWGNRRLRILKFLFTGIQWGFPAAVATIAFEEYFGVYKHHGDAHGHDDKPGHH